MYRSKRFIAFCVAVALFTTMIFLTSYSPMELAGSISMLCGIYIGAETFRGSSPEPKQ